MKLRSLWVVVSLGALVFLGLIVYGNAPELLRSLSGFPLAHWPMILGLSLGNFFIRLLRWLYFLNLLQVKANGLMKTVIFLVGLSMTLTPGRVGELAKPYFLKERLNVPVAVSGPAVIAERISDVGSLLLLGLWGLISVASGWISIIVVLAILGLLTVFVFSPKGIYLLARLPLFRRWESFLSTSGDSLHQLLSPGTMVIGVGLGALAWFAEGLAFWLVIQGIGSSLQLPTAVSVYCAATLLGAVTMLPGGLGATEGSMLVLLQQAGLGNPVASASTLVIRVCTLWFGVVVGLIAILYLQLLLPKEGRDFQST